MRVLLVGDSTDFAEAVIQLGTCEEVQLGRVKTVQKAEQLLNHGELAVVVLPHIETDSWDGVSVLSGLGARVIVVSSHELPAYRDAALAAGASEVMFLPVEPLRLRAAALALLGRVEKRDSRSSTSLTARIDLPGGSTIAARLSNLSREGFQALTQEWVPLGEIITVRPQEGLRLDRLHGYVVGRSEGPEGTTFINARIVGLLRAEEARIVEYLRSVAPEGAMNPVLNALAALDASTILSARNSEIAGIRVPPLTDVEVSGLKNEKNTVAEICVARCRATMLATLHEQGRPAFQLPPASVLEKWREDLAEAVRALERRLRDTEMDEDALHPYRDLKSRVDLAKDQLESVIEQTGLGGG